MRLACYITKNIKFGLYMKKVILNAVLAVALSLSTYVHSKDTTERYNPYGKPEFVFAPIKDGGDEKAYRGLCFEIPAEIRYTFSPHCSQDKLNYEFFVGKRFFFTGEYVVAPFGDVAKEIMIENGTRLHLIFNKGSSSYMYADHIAPLDQKEHSEISAFKPFSLYPGSKTTVVGVERKDELTYQLDNRRRTRLTKNEIDFLRKIASRYADSGPAIADLLSSHVFEYDDFDKRVVIYGMASQGFSTFWSLRILINDNGDVIPFIATNLRSKEWLFASRYSVSADGFRWDSDKVDFKRRNEHGYVYEWNTSDAGNFGLSLARLMSEAEKSIVRFRGKNAHFDHELSVKQKAEIASLLDLYTLLAQRSQGEK